MPAPASSMPAPASISMPAPAYSMPTPASSIPASSTSSEYSNHFGSGELFPATDYSDWFSNNANSQHQV
jgi:hypothetical protein